ncbi:hypothetical protein C8R47DRAFT_1224797 [Mycena vitilis]|nr:hypothetical protein C8R47DRAFT_1224797 [Mycena vitilis]
MNVPPELVEQIIYHGWNCLSSTSHRHGYSMTQWMLVSRDWLKIVLSVVFRDLWLTSPAHANYINSICKDHPSFICMLAGIADVSEHLAETCQSLTISVYQQYEEDYPKQCKDLIDYATDEHRTHLLRSLVKTQDRAISPNILAEFIRTFTPRIAALHFVLIDCSATYRDWEAWAPLSPSSIHLPPARSCSMHLVALFPPPRIDFDIPDWYTFHGVKNLVVRDANADFVAFMITACPRLEKIESTAEFRAEDVPEQISVGIKEHMVLKRLPRSTEWPGVTTHDTAPRPEDWRIRAMEAIASSHGIDLPPGPQVAVRDEVASSALSSETQAVPPDPRVVVHSEITSAALCAETQVVPPVAVWDGVTGTNLSPEIKVAAKKRIWRLAERVFRGRKWPL